MEELQKLQLKLEAYRDRVSNLTLTYEDRVADLRVELTLMAQKLAEAEQRVAHLEELESDRDAENKDSAPDEN